MTTRDDRIREAFNTFVGDPRYPCLAARGFVRRDQYRLAVCGPLGSAEATAALAPTLASFAGDAKRAADSDPLTALVAVFIGGASSGEVAFERRLWAQLQHLHDRDDPASAWDAAVSDDPDDPHFSFSFAGTALFVIGLHPESSRAARRFAWPALVFNPHAQFERLRRDGQFDRLRDRIRDRDVALQGTINPNLSDFGERSEARQYSGRDTSATAWTCPFHANKR
jgi:FPC/CPF motif-containing protein YcgG